MTPGALVDIEKEGLVNVAEERDWVDILARAESPRRARQPRWLRRD